MNQRCLLVAGVLSVSLLIAGMSCNPVAVLLDSATTDSGPQTGEEITTLVETETYATMRHSAYSPDGQQVAFSTENIVWVWEVAER